MFIILTTLLSYISSYISPTQFWPIAIVGLGYPYLLIANSLLIIFWLLIKPKLALFSLFTILIGWPHVQGTVGLGSWVPVPNQNFNPETRKHIQLTSFNCKAFQNFQRRKPFDKVDWDAIHLNLDTDILCLQEGRNIWGSLLVAEELKKYLDKNQLIYSSILNGLAIYSKYPIQKVAGKYYKHSRFGGHLVVDVQINQQFFRLINFHLRSNNITNLINQLFRSGQIHKKSTWKKIKRVIANYRWNTAQRMEQVKDLRLLIEQSPHPIILSGDFNDVSQSYNYNQLAQGLTDAFKSKGFGKGSTFSGKIPWLRIDFIFLSSEFTIEKCQTIRNIRASDHYPLRCNFYY